MIKIFSGPKILETSKNVNNKTSAANLCRLLNVKTIYKTHQNFIA